jgi:hypothetical protein
MGRRAVIDLREASESVKRLAFERDSAEAAESRERVGAERAAEEVAATEEARIISQSIAEELQRSAHDKIARVVTRCLAAVFDNPYEFRIKFERKRGKTEAVLEFQRNGETYSDPLNEVGGGVLDVAALALRLACVMVSKPPARRTFVLDEPWTHVRGKDNRARTCRLLEMLAEEFNVQWILNTDVPSYRMGCIVEMEA